MTEKDWTDLWRFVISASVGGLGAFLGFSYWLVRKDIEHIGRRLEHIEKRQNRIIDAIFTFVHAAFPDKLNETSQILRDVNGRT